MTSSISRSGSAGGPHTQTHAAAQHIRRQFLCSRDTLSLSFSAQPQPVPASLPAPGINAKSLRWAGCPFTPASWTAPPAAVLSRSGDGRRDCGRRRPTTAEQPGPARPGWRSGRCHVLRRLMVQFQNNLPPPGAVTLSTPNLHCLQRLWSWICA